MRFHSVVACAFVASLVLFTPPGASAESSGALTLTRALQRAVAANPIDGCRARHRHRGRQANTGRRDPESRTVLRARKRLRDRRISRAASAETTLQLSQLIELGGKREARIAAGSAELESARWQREAVRLEILSDTAVAFFNVLSGQRQASRSTTPRSRRSTADALLQRRVEAGASSPAEIARAQLAADLVRAERERARTALAIARRELAILMGASARGLRSCGRRPRPGRPAAAVPGRVARRSTAIRNWSVGQRSAPRRDAELLSARLKPIPDLTGRARMETHPGDDRGGHAARQCGEARRPVPIPVWDQNLGRILEAREARAKVEAERAASRAALILTLGQGLRHAGGSVARNRDPAELRASECSEAVKAIESGYSQGRFTLLEVLDVQSSATQAALRELEALASFHTSVATIEGLTGTPLGLVPREAR